MKKAKLIQTINTGTCILKVWEYEFMGRRYSYNTVHYKIYDEDAYMRIGLTKFGQEVALKHGLHIAKAF